MKIQLHKQHIFVLICSLVFLSLFYIGGYFLYLKPIKDSVRQIDSSVTLLQKQLDKTATPNNQEPKLNTSTLQQKVPVTPLVDQFVLDLEKAEVASNSTIQSIEFSEGGAVIPLKAEQPLPTDEKYPEGENEAQGEKIAIPSSPEGLEQLSITVTVNSDSFYDLKTFVETIEQQTRVTMVNQLSFQAAPEVTEMDQEINSIESQLHLTAFYMPTLTELVEETPSINVPPPSQKSNPLTPSINEKNDE